MRWPWKKDPLRRLEKDLTRRLRRVEEELKALDPASTRKEDLQTAESFLSGTSPSHPTQPSPPYVSPTGTDSKNPPSPRGMRESPPFSKGPASSPSNPFPGIKARMAAAWKARQEQRRREQERLRNLAMQLRASGSLEDIPLIRYERRVARNRRIALLLLLGLLGLGTFFYLFFSRY